MEIRRKAMPNIAVDDEVFAALQERAKPFVDSPNSVLRREFGLDARPEVRSPGAGSPTLGRRAARGAAIAQADYEFPVLKVLDAMGGSGQREAVLRELERFMGDRLGDMDRAVLASGSIRWEKTASWAVKNMKNKGLLEPTETAGWGVWSLSDAGRQFLRKAGR
jgi:hypothetical protein